MVACWNVETSVGFDITIQAALDAAQDLSLGQEMDAAVSLGIAAMQMKDGTAGVVDATTSNGTTDFRGVIQRQDSTKKRRKKPQAVFEDVLRKVVVQSLYKTTSVFSHYHTLVEGKGNQGGVRVSGAKNIHRAAKKLETAVSILRKTGGAVRGERKRRRDLQVGFFYFCGEGRMGCVSSNSPPSLPFSPSPFVLLQFFTSEAKFGYSRQRHLCFGVSLPRRQRKASTASRTT